MAPTYLSLSLKTQEDGSTTGFVHLAEDGIEVCYPFSLAPGINPEEVDFQALRDTGELVGREIIRTIPPPKEVTNGENPA